MTFSWQGFVSFLFGIIAAVCFWRAFKNWRLYRKNRRRPIIPTEVSDQALDSAPVAWPLDAKRWPQPYTVSQTRADAYARLAQRSARASTVVGEVLMVVGGAWLGALILNIGAEFRAERDETIAEMSTGSMPGPVFSAPPTWSLPVVGVAAGVCCLVVARWYLDAEAAYLEAARQRPEPIERSPVRSSRKAWFSDLFQNWWA